MPGNQIESSMMFPAEDRDSPIGLLLVTRPDGSRATGIVDGEHLRFIVEAGSTADHMSLADNRMFGWELDGWPDEWAADDPKLAQLRILRARVEKYGWDEAKARGFE